VVSLYDSDAGSYRIAWLVGRRGRLLQEQYGFAVDDSVEVVRSYGIDGTVVRVAGRDIALDGKTAYAVKLVAC
jgi:hypothetical protein